MQKYIKSNYIDYPEICDYKKDNYIINNASDVSLLF